MAKRRLTKAEKEFLEARINNAYKTQDGVIGQLHARVRALEEQLQQPVVQAEHV